jgi:hypothetical protein
MVATMALDPHQSLTTAGGERAPAMLRRPADAPPPLPPLHGHEAIRGLHLEWARTDAPPTADTNPGALWRRARGKARRTIPLGRGDRELIGGLIRAVEAIAVRCDELADRLARQESLMEDVSDSFGQDITLVRAELDRIRTTLD